MTKEELEASLQPLFWEKTEDGGYYSRTGLTYDLHLFQMPNESWCVEAQAGSLYSGVIIGFAGTLERAKEIAREYQVIKVCNMFYTKP